MLLAVLEKRCNITTSNQDVYVSTVGGVRLTEPGADLAIALAVASAMLGNPIDHSVVAFGEISLAGEIRPVASSKQRASEAARLGFRTRVDESVERIQNAIDRAFGAVPSDSAIPEF